MPSRLSLADVRAEWAGGVQHHIEKDPQGPVVHTVAVTLPGNLLRRHVVRIPYHGVHLTGETRRAAVSVALTCLRHFNLLEMI